MIDAEEVTVVPASQQDFAALSNLLELYSHDLSDVFSLETGPDGRFGYAKLSLYASEPGKRFPFLIHHGPRLAGFAFVTRGSPASEDASVFDVAEFFVLRRHRRAGVGRRAAFGLWNRLHGHWTVRVANGNRDGLEFWSRVVSEYTHGSFEEKTVAGSPHDWRVFSF